MSTATPIVHLAETRKVVAARDAATIDVVPIGPTEEGLPVGMQIITPYLRDRESSDLARHLANVVARFEPPP